MFGWLRRILTRLRTRNITVHKSGEVHIIKIAYSVTLGASAEALRKIVDGLVGTGARFIIIDLCQTIKIDAGGVGTLVSCKQKVTNAGGIVNLLLRPDSPMQEVINLVHLNEVFVCYEDERAALESFS